MDETLFKQVMARFATGVTVVGTMTDDGPVGMTATSFCSVSLDPPLVLVCIDHTVYIHDRIHQSQVFSVSLLTHDQLAWGMRFAGQLDEPPREERYEDIDYLIAESGAPILPECLAWVDCVVHATYDGGDHTIFVGRVLASGEGRAGLPLLYYDRRWAQLTTD